MKRISLTSLLTTWFAVVFTSLSLAATKEDIIEAAKKDREVVFYTTTNVEEADAMSRHFKAKYPFIDVNINRAEGERIVTKVLQETRAKKSPVDVIQTPAFYLHALRKREIIGDYSPADNRFYPRNFKEEKYWTTTYYNPYVVLYNTKLVSAQNLPKRYKRSAESVLEEQNDYRKRQDRLVYGDAEYFGKGERRQIHERVVPAEPYAADRTESDHPVGCRGGGDAANQWQRRDRHSYEAKRRSHRLGCARALARIDGRSGSNISGTAPCRGQTLC